MKCIEFQGIYARVPNKLAKRVVDELKWSYTSKGAYKRAQKRKAQNERDGARGTEYADMVAKIEQARIHLSAIPSSPESQDKKANQDNS